MRLTLDRDFADATDVLKQIFRDLAPEPPAEAVYLGGADRLWHRLAEDGWLDLGGTLGDEDAPSRRELVQVGELWGRHLAPLPYLETLLVRRWLPDTDGAVTIALPARWSQAAIPFLAGTSSVVVGDGDALALIGTDSMEPAREDVTAPSLPLTEVNGVEPIPGRYLDELFSVYAGVAVGTAAAALAQSIEYAHQREAYGQLIGRFQALQHRMANMHRDLEIARTAALWASQDGEPAARATRACLDRARSVLEGAMQVFGGISYTWELGLHYYLRHVLALRQLVPPVDV